MNFGFFTTQMERIADCFGGRCATKAFADTLWSRMKNTDDDLFRQCVDHVILTQKASPTIMDFYAGIGEAKKKIHDAVRKAEAATAHEFFASEIGNEEIQRRTKMINGRQAGVVSDKDFAYFKLELLDSAKAGGEFKNEEELFQKQWAKNLAEFEAAGGVL